MESICYLSQILNNETNNTKIFIEKNVKLNYRNEVYMKRIYISSQPQYITLLVRNTKNNELISFQPILVQLNSTWTSFVISMCIIIIIILICYSYFDCVKDKILDWYVNGFSLGFKKNETIKYSNLSDNYY